jgi:hypothetical protein
MARKLALGDNFVGYMDPIELPHHEVGLLIAEIKLSGDFGVILVEGCADPECPEHGSSPLPHVIYVEKTE